MLHEPGHDSINFMHIGWSAKCAHICIEVTTCDLLTSFEFKGIGWLLLRRKDQQQIALLSEPILVQGPHEFVLCAKFKILLHHVIN